jgi:hypothetical protein
MTVAAERLPIRVEGGAIRVEGDKVAPNGEAYDQLFVLSTERMASDAGIILLDAWQTARFKKNPRFIAMHDIYGFSGRITDIVVGTVVWVGVRTDLDATSVHGGKALVGAVRFANTSFAKEMRTLYVDGDLDAVSVRWDAATAKNRDPTDAEQAQWPGLEWVCERADLLEVSAVILGADADALALRSASPTVVEAVGRLKARGISLPAVERLVRDATPEEPEPPEEEPASDLEVDLEAIAADTGEVTVEEPEVEKPDTAERAESTEAAVRADVDSAALSDGLRQAEDALEALDLWIGSYASVRSTIGDSLMTLRNLIGGGSVVEKEQIDPLKPDAGKTEKPAKPEAKHSDETFAELRKLILRMEAAQEGLEARMGELAARVESKPEIEAVEIEEDGEDELDSLMDLEAITADGAGLETT